MGTFVETATLATGYYGTSTWGPAPAAYQGAAGTVADATKRESRVGVIAFPQAGAALKNTSIKSITLEMVASAAGYGVDVDKVLTIRESNIQELDKSISSTTYVGDLLGTITGAFHGNTVMYTLTESSHKELFSGLRQYFEDGNSCLVLYNGEYVGGTASFSENYLALSSVTITVEYTDDYVYYNDNGTPVKCAVYYNNRGSAVRCAVYYNNGGTAVRV